MRNVLLLSLFLWTSTTFGHDTTPIKPSNQLELKDKISLTISSLAFVIAAASFIFSRYIEWKTAQGAVIKAFQGEKETIAYIAYKIRSKRWNTRFQRKRFRQDIITALCLAWSLEGADRTKAIIFDTLKEIKEQGFTEDIKNVLQNMRRQFVQYRDAFHPDKFDHRVTSLESLMTELDIPLA